MTKKITKITTQKRVGRYNVFIDEKYAFPIGEEVLISFHLAKGMELDDALIKQIADADDRSKAYSKALNYLSTQMRTVKEIKDYLKKHEITEDAIEETIEKLYEFRLVNNLEYAKSYVRTMMHTSDKGPAVIRQKLRLKGVAVESIDEALEEFPVDEQLENGIKVAEKLVKHYHDQSFRNLINKVRQALMTKGFKSDEVSQIMDNLELEMDPEVEWDALVKQGDKVWKRQRGLEGSQRAMKVKQGLFQKGFQFDDINEYIELKEQDEALE
ncbi:recombination regulator RecX [Dellaglioa algida]|uniref:recombination regulator RecX n=1 Tax=Dellaglioa algida TaxID=105612 RepID=UPI0024C4D17C|nr:recombination regulator RecX [Dellaglioa algida]MDK1724740.1 recombination regulator RecX [Dellaglioa algida]MDK1738720.1 recombination regulator RecX [Dellaglioa algida]